MKKLFCLILTLVCIASAAFAAVPSRTTADMNTTTQVTDAGNNPITGLTVTPVADTEADRVQYEQKLEAAKTELNKLRESFNQTGSIEAYFGEVADTNDNPVSLAGKTVDEFMPLAVSGVETIGDADVNVGFNLATKYEMGESVVVLIGVVNDLTGEVEWVALEGVGTEDGGIVVTFPAAVLAAIENGTAMMAVASDI